MRLSRSYRSAPTIVRAAMQLIRPGTLVPGRELIPARTDIPDGPVGLHAVADEREEAEAVAAEIERLLGGASFHALDSRAVDGRDRTEHQLSFADFAVLYRTSSQAAAVERGPGQARLPRPAARALPAGRDAGRGGHPGGADPGGRPLRPPVGVTAASVAERVAVAAAAALGATEHAAERRSRRRVLLMAGAAAIMADQDRGRRARPAGGAVRRRPGPVPR